LLFVLFYVLFVCKCVLPPGDNPIAVHKYIKYIKNPTWITDTQISWVLARDSSVRPIQAISFWEGFRCSENKKFPRLSWNPKVHYRVKNHNWSNAKNFSYLLCRCSAYFMRTGLIMYHNMPWTGENTEFLFDKYLQIFCIYFLSLKWILLKIALITDISPFGCRSGFALIQKNGYNKLVCMFKHSHCWITGTKIKYSKNNGTKNSPF
jgi:hypothetical protein